MVKVGDMNSSKEKINATQITLTIRAKVYLKYLDLTIIFDNPIKMVLSK
ncbi:MAG: hypothetical protein ACFFDK_00910 [Promethearchaeota archaeon]